MSRLLVTLRRLAGASQPLPQVRNSSRVRIIGCLLLLGLIVPSSGCSFYRNSVSDSRLDAGLTIILPGVEGKSLANGNIARGLESGGVATAIQVHDWTTGFAPLFLVHLRDADRHRREAEALVTQIIDYQRLYPGRPVFLIGHSGGGAMVLRTLELLPQEHRVAGAILLAPAISPDYPISESLLKTNRGIWNYYSALDFPLLIAGTSIAGTVDGQHRPSAGAVGFTEPSPSATGAGDRPELVQIPYSPGMLRQRHLGGHFGWTDPLFVREHLAPIIQAGVVSRPSTTMPFDRR